MQGVGGADGLGEIAGRVRHELGEFLPLVAGGAGAVGAPYSKPMGISQPAPKPAARDKARREAASVIVRSAAKGVPAWR